MGETNEWTKERIELLLAEEDLRYQKIRLPHGLSTPGEDRTGTADLVLGADLAGRSLLDVGSYLGFFSLAAKERGAGDVVGWEVDPDRARKARLLADVKGVDVTYELCDIETWDGDDSFDVVLCLNLLHHLRDPIAVIDKLIRLTREKLVLEIATIGRHDRKKFKLSALAARWIAKRPIMLVGRGDTSGNSAQQKFFFTRGAIRNLLEHQRNAFARVEIVDSDFKDRFLVIAHKRRVRELVVVAGPTSSGKTTFIDEMGSDAHPELGERLGAGSLADWERIDASKLARRGEPEVERLILHYDFLRPYDRSARVPDRDEALDVLKGADRVSFVTLYTPPVRLREQLLRGELSGPVKHPRHLRVQRLYERDETIWRLYRDWLAFVDAQPGRLRGEVGPRLVVEPRGAEGGGLAIRTHEEWAATTRR